MPSKRARVGKSGGLLISGAVLGVLVALGGCAALVVDEGPRADKVRVCHKGKKTLEVAGAALDAHLKHGDTIGVCR